MKNATVVFQNEGERYSFRFREQNKLQLITALRGFGPLESQNRKHRLARSIVWRDEIDLRVVSIKQTKNANVSLERNRTLSSFRARKKPRRNARNFTRQDAF